LGKIWLILSLAAIRTETMAFYGFLSNLISKRDGAPQEFGLGIGASIGLLNVCKWYPEAQKVEDCVSMISSWFIDSVL